MSAEDYEYWRGALDGNPIPLQTATDPETGFEYPEPAPGFYRQRQRDGSWEPVAVWRNGDGDIVAKVGTRRTVPADSAFSERVFSYACKHPVPEDIYRKALAGEGWPEDAPDADAVKEKATKRAEKAAAEAEATTAKDDEWKKNAPEHVIIEETIKELRAEADKWLKSIGGKITTQEQADKAANFADRFAESEREATKAHKREKEPHLEAGRKVDRTWKPVITLGDQEKRWAKNLNTEFLRAEAQRKAQEIAEKARSGEQVKPADMRAKAGTRGRSVSLVERRSLKITDAGAMYAHYRDDERLFNHPDLWKIVGKMAEADIASGKTVPGAHIHTEQVAR